MTYRQRLSLFLIIDSIIVLLALGSSWFLVGTTNMMTFPLAIASVVILISHHTWAIKVKLYKKVWEYASVGELVTVLKVVIYSFILAVVVQQLFFQVIYGRFLIVSGLLHLLFLGGSRFAWRLYRDMVMNHTMKQVRTLIVGAGSAGTMVARQLLNNQDSSLLPVAFVDDDPSKHALDLLGIPIVGGVSEIAKSVKELHIDNIIIAIPSLKKRELNTIYQECLKTTANTKILPLLEDLVTGKVSVTAIRDVQAEDLLPRELVDIDMESIGNEITNKVVLVTGAGGSIGSEISKQIAAFFPRRLILLGHGENSIYTIEMKLKEQFKNENIDFVTEIADIQDEQKIMSIVRMYKPNVIYHAAAHKHVPLMEHNPDAALNNNIIGTLNVAKAASKNKTQTFVLVSTDKAVNPTSVMGASKRIAEMAVQSMDKESDTTFVAVRFGNVLGSRGSVIPLFKKQIERGGPVTVTHPDMVRYFMTIPEASRLVIQAGALAKGGEIFVLDMGDPVKIVELAKNLIQLSGYDIEDIGLEFTGIRPGEKLYEELLTAEEVHEQQLYPKIYIGKTTEVYLEDIERLIARLVTLDKEHLKEQLLTVANKGLVLEQSRAISI
ncbi:polysaccharide biosynthesis protein [Virgibacillus sp. W0430]|uniref:polysaccharide biosynthesis protein n=1 Tax=Virgibacillus sp. W0430 TaxID=3391580 RepID=UPI003F44E4A0